MGSGDLSRSRFVVTGGGGFVGNALIRRLVEGGASVCSLARGEYPALRDLGVESVQHDLGSEDPLPEGFLSGIDGIFHTAAHVKMWGPYDEFYRTNVLGTRKLLEGAVRYGVGRFVYTSSPSVIANGSHLRGVDETFPYPEKYEAFYPRTKAEAEQEVLLANGTALFSCSLRPHLIFGPGDTNLIPTVVKRAWEGKLKRIGEGDNLVDFTFIDDCVEAHLLAMQALEENPASRGQAYFISQGDPYPLWKWIDEVLAYHELPPVKASVSYPLAHMVAAVSEQISRLLPFLGEPRFTKFLVSEMYTDHYFDISRAEKKLGFRPRYSVTESLKQTFEARASEKQAA